MILWLKSLHDKSNEEAEKKLLTLLLNKIDRVFKLDDKFVTYWIQKNPKHNPLEKEFNDGIALLEAEEQSEVNKNIIKSVKELAPDLKWYEEKTPSLKKRDTENKYANPNIVGERGVIYDDNLTVGLTVMPPNIQCPEHRHKAEEFYLVSNNGKWNKSGGEWVEKKLGDYVYNESNIIHSTKSGDEPLVTL